MNKEKEMTDSFHLLGGDCLTRLKELPDNHFHTVITSPPYWALRAYGTESQIWGGNTDCDHDFLGATCIKCDAWKGEFGQEPTPSLYIAHLVEICRQIRRVLRKDGTFWLNLGDCYLSSKGKVEGIKSHDLVGIPWQTALALRQDGWFLRSDIIWEKKNPMPEAVTNRPTKSHEYIFLLTKSEKYYYDSEAIMEEGSANGGSRNKRSVWSVNAQPFPNAHFAVFPTKLIEPCVLAGSSEKGCCPDCGAPWIRQTISGVDMKAPDMGLNIARPQAKRAVELFRASNLDERHISAIKAVGIADTGKALVTTDGAGKNTLVMQNMASEAKVVLGGYYREFLSPVKRSVGWQPSCGCGSNLLPDDLELILTPTGRGENRIDPTKTTGRKGLNRVRGEGEGQRPMTRYEQRAYAAQLKKSPHRKEMESEAGQAFAHYIRTDRSGARPIPVEMLNAWLLRGLLTKVEVPTPKPAEPAPTRVLDPFAGTATTGFVSVTHGREFVGIELNPEYLEMAKTRMEEALNPKKKKRLR